MGASANSIPAAGTPSESSGSDSRQRFGDQRAVSNAFELDRHRRAHALAAHFGDESGGSKPGRHSPSRVMLFARPREPFELKLPAPRKGWSLLTGTLELLDDLRGIVVKERSSSAKQRR